MSISLTNVEKHIMSNIEYERSQTNTKDLAI